jgi:hypothetical protein
MSTSHPLQSWSATAALIGIKEFNTFNFTVDTDAANGFTQVGQWSQVSQVTGNTTSFSYGFNTQVNAVKAQVAGNILQTWVSP